MKTPSDFIKLDSLTKDEIYSHPETIGTYSWQGDINSISKSDLEHLLTGKPLLFVVNEEYNCIIKLVK
ncbi:hypothetical protein QP705_01290 [Limosilactobacillus reuteri]|uniref:hypothetical protein n=1 Tax=Limosilactobacillus reuteri TaxID=1598 RepID=UPI000A1DE86F|nr:hypothetical protein [Limosilactobacillus reuteri]MDK8115840.1 hypothetical protein [Limosilactobacillus reuteri]MQB65537.1 hypothetical protein [Limosilactobacillus reuteri]